MNDLFHDGGLGLDDGLGASSNPQPTNNVHPVCAFRLEKSKRSKDHILVYANGSAPVVSVVYSKSKPNVTFYAGGDAVEANKVGDGNFSKSWNTSTLSMRGAAVSFKGNQAGNYVFTTPADTFTWELDTMSGSLAGLYDQGGRMVARFRPEGMLSDVKTLELLIQTDRFLTDLILFSAVTVRMFEKATVKQVKRAMDVTGAVSAVMGALRPA